MTTRRIRSVLIACLFVASAHADEPVRERTRILSRDAITARYTDAASKFVDLDGVSVHYKDEGAGPVVLLVHGSYGDLADWDGWVTLLAPSYRVVRLDLPGFGISGALASGNYSIDRMLTVIDSLMDHLHVERFALVGVSYGGAVSFRYAATRTERVTALVLANSAGVEMGRPPTAKADAPAKPMYNVMTDASVTRADVQTFYDYLINDHGRITPALIQRKLDFANIADRDRESILARQQYERGDPQRVLSHVRAPTLVLWGDANQALQTKTADAFVSYLTHACSTRRIVYPGGGHMINLDRPLETATDAKAFLDQQLSPDGSARCRTAGH